MRRRFDIYRRSKKRRRLRPVRFLLKAETLPQNLKSYRSDFYDKFGFWASIATIFGLLFGIYTLFLTIKANVISQIINSYQLLAQEKQGNIGKSLALNFLNTSDCLFGSSSSYREIIVDPNNLDLQSSHRCWLGVEGVFEGPKGLVGYVTKPADTNSFSDMSDLALYYAYIDRVSFATSRIYGGFIARSTISNTSLSDSYILKMKLINNIVHKLDLSCSYISVSDIVNNNVYNVKFDNSFIDMSKLYFLSRYNKRFPFSNRNVSFRGASIMESDITFESAEIVNFDDSSIVHSHVKIRDAKLVDMKRATLWGSTIDFVDELYVANNMFQGANLTGANLSNIRVLGKIDFSETYYCKAFPPPTMPKGYSSNLVKPMDCHDIVDGLLSTLKNYNEKYNTFGLLREYPSAYPIKMLLFEEKNKCGRSNEMNVMNRKQQNGISLKRGCIRYNEDSHEEAVIGPAFLTTITGNRGTEAKINDYGSACPTE